MVLLLLVENNLCVSATTDGVLLRMVGGAAGTDDLKLYPN